MNATLANISFAVRFLNLTDEESSRIPETFFANPPTPVKTSERFIPGGNGYKPHRIVTETFSDGSTLNLTASIP